jgi:type II secretory pathway pseudopilin PulG
MARLIRTGSYPRRSRGFSYLIVLSLVLVMLLSLGVASEHIEVTRQREREAELIFAGQQYQNAIGSYYQKSPNGLKEYPSKLSDLLDDKRSLSTNHHIRKLYIDPITGAADWGLVRNTLGQIIGVYSLSQQKPITTREDLSFAHPSGESAQEVASYSDWKFIYTPPKGKNKNAPEASQAGFSNDNAFKSEDF